MSTPTHIFDTSEGYPEPERNAISSLGELLTTLTIPILTMGPIMSLMTGGLDTMFGNKKEPSTEQIEAMGKGMIKGALEHMDAKVEDLRTQVSDEKTLKELKDKQLEQKYDEVNRLESAIVHSARGHRILMRW